MKAFLLKAAAIGLFCISSFGFHHGPCRSGNDALVIQEAGGDSFVACCVGVGGGQLSCTAGGCWFNYPDGSSGGATAIAVPDCIN